MSPSSSSVSLILHSLTYIPVGTPFLFWLGVLWQVVVTVTVTVIHGEDLAQLAFVYLPSYLCEECA